MRKGASIRLDEPTGIRFTTEISKSYYDYCVATYDEVELYTIICPTDYIVSEFAAEALNAAGKAYKTIKCNVFANWSTAEADGYYQFNAVLANILQTNYSRKFSAVTYLMITDNGNIFYEYSYYCPENNSRSVSMISQMALADVSETSRTGYTNLIPKGELYQTKFSSYDLNSRTILYGFARINDTTDNFFDDIY